MQIDDQAIHWAYRLFLDREPEKQAVIDCRNGLFQSSSELRNHFLNSTEYREKNPSLCHPSYVGYKPRLNIEIDVGKKDLARLFRRVEAAWETFGKNEPHWSVMSFDRFRETEIGTTLDEFNQSGRNDVALIEHTLKRNGLELRMKNSCTEIGCGVGRITRWLSPIFKSINAYDVSAPHLQFAKAYLSEIGASNVNLHRITGVTDFKDLPKTDFVFSIIVLQHNPPPIIAYMIRAILDSLNSGGFALFQIPTYLDNYAFDCSSYLNSDPEYDTIEMHIIPQSVVFDIADSHACKVIEVAEDDSIGQPPGGISNTFLLQKK